MLFQQGLPAIPAPPSITLGNNYSNKLLFEWELPFYFPFFNHLCDSFPIGSDGFNNCLPVLRLWYLSIVLLNSIVLQTVKHDPWPYLWNEPTWAIYQYCANKFWLCGLLWHMYNRIYIIHRIYPILYIIGSYLFGFFAALSLTQDHLIPKQQPLWWLPMYLQVY